MLTKEELLEKLAEKRRELGRNPTFSEVKSDPNCPSTSEISYRFGSFDAAMVELDAYHKPEEDASGRIKIKGKKPRRVMMKQKWLAKIRGAKGVGMTREEMLDRLIQIKQENGEITDKAIRRDSVLVHYDVMREFGSLGAMKKQVKLEMQKRRKERLAAAAESAEEAKPVEADTSLPAEAKLIVPIEHEEFKAEMRKVFDKRMQSESEKEEKMVEHKRKARLTKEECLAEMKQLANELGHVPTWTDIRAMGASEATIQKKLGPRCYWDELLGVPFTKASAASAEKAKAKLEGKVLEATEEKSVETAEEKPVEVVERKPVKAAEKKPAKAKKAEVIEAAEDAKAEAAETVELAPGNAPQEPIEAAVDNVRRVLNSIHEMALVTADLEVASEIEVAVGGGKTAVISICTK